MSGRRSSRPARAASRGCARQSHRLDERRAEEARPIPRSRPERVHECRRRLDEEHELACKTNAGYEHYRVHGRTSDGRLLGRPPKPWKPPERPAGKINLTDPDSRNLKSSRLWLQSYNAQAAVNEHHIVVAAEVTVDSPDFGHIEPMVDAVQSELAAAGVAETPEVVVADAGYWHQEQMERAAGRGIGVLIPPDAATRKDARPGWRGGLYAFTRRAPAHRAIQRNRLPASPRKRLRDSHGA
jgi:hypothetical protein